MAGFVWKLRCALLCAKFFSVLKDTTSSPKTYRDFQETDSSKGFFYKYSVHPLSSKTNLQVQFDSESMADEESLFGLSITYMFLSNYRIYLFIYYFFFRWKGKGEETTTNQELDDGRKNVSNVSKKMNFRSLKHHCDYDK